MSASSLEEDIRQVIKAHLEAGAEREPETIDNFMAIISDNYTGIGTGPEEFFRSKLQFRENTLREREVMIYKVDLEMPVLYVRSIHPDLVLAEGAGQKSCRPSQLGLKRGRAECRGTAVLAHQ